MASELKTTLGLGQGLTVLTGRAGVGKTKTLVDIGRAFQDAGVPVLLINTDEGSTALQQRFPDITFQCVLRITWNGVDRLIRAAPAGSAVLIDGAQLLRMPTPDHDEIAVFRTWLDKTAGYASGKPLYLVATTQAPRTGRGLRLPYPTIELTG